MDRQEYEERYGERTGLCPRHRKVVIDTCWDCDCDEEEDNGN